MQKAKEILWMEIGVPMGGEQACWGELLEPSAGFSPSTSPYGGAGAGETANVMQGGVLQEGPRGKLSLQMGFHRSLRTWARPSPLAREISHCQGKFNRIMKYF